MSGEDVYESLPDGSSIGVTLGAGAMAGIMEHCVMFPVDCVKVCQFCDCCLGSKYRSALITIIYLRQECKPLHVTSPSFSQHLLSRIFSSL